VAQVDGGAEASRRARRGRSLQERALGLLAASGLPPFSGFVAKFGILTGSEGSAGGYALWALVLISGFATLARAAEAWLTIAAAPGGPRHLRASMLQPMAGLALLGLGLALAAAPFLSWSEATAHQLAAPVDRAALEVQVHARGGVHR